MQNDIIQASSETHFQLGKKLISFLFRDRSPGLSYILAVIFSLLLCFYLLPWSFLQGQGGYFAGADGDVVQHVSGWLFYVHDQWRFPLGYTQRLNYPEGANIILADTIPILAVIFKLFRQWLPADFHYFGWWVGFVYFLQSLAAVMLMRALGYRSLVAVITAIIFALLSPAMIAHFTQSLTIHGLILFAFGTYVLGIKRQWSFAQSAWVLILISICALLVHPYLFGMLYPIFIAFLIDYKYKNPHETYQVLVKHFVWSLLVILGVLFLFGYFEAGGGGDSGFGYYSMNLLAPFCGGKYAISCSNILGQSEGFNYLGIGLIFLLVLTLVTQWRWCWRLPKRFPALTLLMVLFSLFALSNAIYLGHIKLIEIKLPDFILNLAAFYRSSGRFFWPVGYALLFMSIVGILRLQSKSFIWVFLFLAVCLQWSDVWRIFQYSRSLTQIPTPDISTTWGAFPGNAISGIDMFPLYQDYPQTDSCQRRYQFFMLLAAKKQWTFNTAKLAHYHDARDTDAKKRFFNYLQNNHLYIVMSDVSPDTIPLNLQLLLRQKEHCRQFSLTDHSTGTACVPNSNSQWWQKNAPWMREY